MREKPPDSLIIRCPSCKGEFASYRGMGYVQCPRCGREVRIRSGRGGLRIAAVVLLAVILAAAVYYWLRLR
jgi:predicted RNA-binding Zn-ribbon protein involved in translation (DUF1610 family)